MTSIRFIDTDTDLDAAIDALVAADPRLGEIVAAAGRPPLRRREPGFAGLAAIICAQQLSTASASAIFARLCALGEPFDHTTVLRTRSDRLRRIGLSAPKIRSLKAIAKAIAAGDLDLAGLGSFAADDAHAALTRIHGIGPWTADIYLLSCLGHADAWPAGDLALQEAARIVFALTERPTAREMGPLSAPWRPLRGVAARILWTYYRHLKGRSGAPLPTEGRNPAPAPAQSGGGLDGRSRRSTARTGRDGAPSRGLPSRIRRRR